MRAFSLLIFVLLSDAARADFSVQVVHVQDGDTLTVLVDKRQVKVPLDAIDAPELKQAFGQRSKQSLLDI